MSAVKAFHIFHRDPADGSLLVFHRSARLAKSYGVRRGPYDWAYLNVSCERVERLDGLFKEPRIVESNDELPASVAPFYDDSIC